MRHDFKTAVQALMTANKDFASRRLSPVGHRDAREAAMAQGLAALAMDFGVTLRQPLQVDSLGEISIVAVHPDGRDPSQGCGGFGAFVEVLNRYSPRTGVSPGAILTPECGWCRMNHFQVEKMLLEHIEGPTPDAPNPAEATSADPARAVRRNRP